MNLILYIQCMSFNAFTFFFDFFFFNDTATTEIYTLSLHDALPITRHSERSGPTFSCPFARAKGSACAERNLSSLLLPRSLSHPLTFLRFSDSLALNSPAAPLLFQGGCAWFLSLLCGSPSCYPL